MTLQLRTEAGGYSNSQAAESAARESDTTADKCWREYFMLKNGVSTGLQQSAAEAAEHPGTVLAEFGGSAAIGAGLALAGRGGAGWKLAVGLGLAAMTYSFAKDVAGRMGVIKSAVGRQRACQRTKGGIGHRTVSRRPGGNFVGCGIWWHARSGRS
jgi:hypothetical protein